jgi:hypothetical protein
VWWVAGGRQVIMGREIAGTDIQSAIRLALWQSSNLCDVMWAAGHANLGGVRLTWGA